MDDNDLSLDMSKPGQKAIFLLAIAVLATFGVVTGVNYAFEQSEATFIREVVLDDVCKTAFGWDSHYFPCDYEGIQTKLCCKSSGEHVSSVDKPRFYECERALINNLTTGHVCSMISWDRLEDMGYLTRTRPEPSYGFEIES